MPPSADKIDWSCRGYWDYYPENEIGRLTGSALRNNFPVVPYRSKPTLPWNSDAADYFFTGVHLRDTLFSASSRDFISMKLNISRFSVTSKNAKSAFTVSSDTVTSAKMNVLKDNSVYLSINNFWSYPDIGFGNYGGPANQEKQEGGFNINFHIK